MGEGEEGGGFVIFWGEDVGLWRKKVVLCQAKLTVRHKWGKRSRNFGGDNAGPGPCPSRVLRLVTLAELWKRSWRCARRESRRQRRRRYNPKSPPQAFICTYTRFPLPAPARPALRCESVPCAVCRRRYLGAVATDVHTIHGKASDR